MEHLPIMTTDKMTPAQRYYQNHKDSRKQYGREYYERNKERILEANKKKKETLKPGDIEMVAPVASSPLDNFRGRGKITYVAQDVMVSFS